MPRRALQILSIAVVAIVGQKASLAQTRIEAEALVGEPFGVGRLRVALPLGGEPESLGLGGLGVAERQGRVFYPAVDRRPFRGLIRDLVGVGGRRAVVYFLFRGTEPLEMTVTGRDAHAVRVTPRVDPRGLGRMYGAWWQAYCPPPRLLEDEPDYPPLVRRYLQAMLARRFSLPAPARRESTWEDVLGEDVNVLLGFESAWLAMLEDRMLGRLAALAEKADQPLPPAIDPPPLVVPEAAADVAVEPLATRVPEECLYIRFGNVANFLWFRGQLERASGDLGNLVSMRGLDYDLLERGESQLCLRQSTISKMLGATVGGLVGGTAVADVALVGTDLFQREGAAFGMLFHARSSPLLAQEIRRQRDEALKSGRGAVTEETIEIEGREVAFLSTPDNRIRSFYVADGDFHLVTTSRALVRRFLQTRAGKGALGAAPDFRLARSQYPAGRGDTVFLYLSDAFLRNITSPQYRVEMSRRLEAVADVTLVQTAVLAAAAEGRPAGSIEDLRAGGFLPPELGPRPDGSRAVYEDGRAFDSLRGGRGHMLPVADVQVRAVTPSEAKMYARFAEHYRTEWGRLDPTIVAVRRVAAGQGRERITLDARISPLSGPLYEILARHLGPADNRRIAPVEGDLAFGEVVLSRQRLFLGIRDTDPPDLKLLRGKLLVQTAPPGAQLLFQPLLIGYLGTCGDPGLLGLLDMLVGGRADASGLAGSEGGLWRRQFDRFTVFSFQASILAAATPQLKLEPIERPAQAHLRVGDITQTRLAEWINELGFRRTRQTCLGNLQLLHEVEQQLHVPGEDCRQAAELLLDARLACPLRGEYAFRQSRQGAKRWIATALVNAEGRVRDTGDVPDGFQTAPLDWLRGLSLQAVLNPREAHLRAEVLMQVP